jgi:hypothetical protein
MVRRSMAYAVPCTVQSCLMIVEVEVTISRSHSAKQSTAFCSPKSRQRIERCALPVIWGVQSKRSHLYDDAAAAAAAAAAAVVCSFSPPCKAAGCWAKPCATRKKTREKPQGTSGSRVLFDRGSFAEVDPNAARNRVLHSVPSSVEHPFGMSLARGRRQECLSDGKGRHSHHLAPGTSAHSGWSLSVANGA